MANKKDWIDKCLLSANKANILVTADVVVRMKSLLESVLCEQSLRASGLTEISKRLLDDIGAPAASNVEKSHEN